uniref:Sel1 repeat family protein n=1 Tax=Macrostomum lignano TaxID=282301 RepID=A0A1I8F962_9PLAT
HLQGPAACGQPPQKGLPKKVLSADPPSWGYAEGQLQLGLMHYTGITQAGIRGPEEGPEVLHSGLAGSRATLWHFFYLAPQMHAAAAPACCDPARSRRRVVQEWWPSGGRWSEPAHGGAPALQGGIRQRLCRPASLFCFWPTPGYEVAQSNAALHSGPESRGRSSQPTSPYSRAAPAVWSRQPARASAQARLKLADYHYYGLGGPANLEQAASLYRAASEQQSNAQATCSTWPICTRGASAWREICIWPSATTIRLAEASADAYMPVMLALCRLAVEFVMDYLRGGNYSVADLISLLSFSNFWPSATLPPPEQQRGPDSIRLGQAAYDEDGESPDSANQQRQYLPWAAGSRFLGFPAAHCPWPAGK